LSALALRNGYARNTLHCALYKPHPAANRVIARFLGVSLHELWPQWYAPDGGKRRAPNAQSSACRRGGADAAA
jgi:lambda repressor-like predicted transcriptional regulator